jgi:hypothetical protein
MSRSLPHQGMLSVAHAFASSLRVAECGPRSSAGVRRCRPRSLLSWLLASGLADVSGCPRQTMPIAVLRCCTVAKQMVIPN